MAMQIIQKIKDIFEANKLDLYVRPYEMIVTSHNSGMLEFLCNTQSLDSLKKEVDGKRETLLQIY